jgi:hypothetical protein
MKPKPQKTITLAEIIKALDRLELNDARTQPYQSKGAALSITGKVEKLIKRHGGVRLFVKPDQPESEARCMMIFAEFDGVAEQERVIKAGIRKNSMVSFTGKFQTFGGAAVNINGCFLSLGTEKGCRSKVTGEKQRMKQTIVEKAEIAIGALNEAALLMHRQMKSGEIDKTEGDKYIFPAQKKAKAVQTAYFKRTTSEGTGEHRRQMTEFDQSGLFDDFKHTYDRFGKVLKHYAKAARAAFQKF